MTPDPVTQEILLGRLRETTVAMEHALFHSGYSPILRESFDGSAGFTDSGGDAIIGSGGIHYHLLMYGGMVEGVRRVYGAEMYDGDCFIGNDPYLVGNAHVPDVMVATPVFHEDRLIAFAVSISHKSDVGGLVPGSSSAAAREIYHDGFLLPPVRIRTKAGPFKEIEAIIRNNSRTPDELMGDIRAQIGATLLGAERLKALCAEYGTGFVQSTMQWLIDSTTRRIRDAIGRWPDGVVEASGRLDHDGVDKDRPVEIRVRIDKRNDRLTIDFSGTGAQAKGPFNAPRAIVEAVSLIALVTATDFTIPINSGLAKAVDFVFPDRSIVNPSHPATVNNYFPASHISYTCVQSALARLDPSNAIAPAGFSSGAFSVGYPQDRTGHRAVQYELNKTGLGATATHDGVSIAVPVNQFVPGQAIEILESEYPVEVTRFETRPNSGGAGLWRGGLAPIREYKFLADCTLTVRATNFRHGSWGVEGGQPSPTARAVMVTGDGQEEALDCLETRNMSAGDKIRLEYAGGSGFGDPLDRAVESVLADYRNGYVTHDHAADCYGVVLNLGADPEVDATATAKRRSAIKHTRQNASADV